MNILDLLNKNSIFLDIDTTDKKSCIQYLCKKMNETGNIFDIRKYTEGVFNRESHGSTGVGNKIAIPHCVSSVVKNPTLVVLRSNNYLDWNSLDGTPVKLIFLIAAPKTTDNIHLDILANLSSMLMDECFVEKLLLAKNSSEFLEIIQKANIKDNQNNSDIDTSNTNKDLILAVTACPSGVAHTYMAKEALEKAAKKLNVKIKVETNGSSGIKNRLTTEEIAKAKCIICAADTCIEMERFNNKKVLQCQVSAAIKNPEGLINKALSGNIQTWNSIEKSSELFDVGEGSGIGHTIYKHLMSGISHMIPFVVAGGITLAIAYLIDGLCGAPRTGENIDGITYTFGQVNIVARTFYQLGATFGLGLMLPILAGFISFSIAGRQGLVSGFIGGISATKGTFSILYIITALTKGLSSNEATTLATSSAGFIGAIVAGFISGYFVKFLQKKLENVSQTFLGLRDFIIIPVSSTLFIGLSMFLLNAPFGYINIGLFSLLDALQKAKLLVLLAALVAGLMATDMGGPINKAAHYFVLTIVATALQPNTSLEAQTLAFQLQAANIIGIMVPPVGISLACWLFPQKFTKSQRVPALANCFIGICGITEVAIPYLATRPIIYWISCITGSAIGGIISLLLGMEAIAPEGGVVSYFVMGSICWKGLVALLIGSLINAIILGILLNDVPKEKALLGKWKGIKLSK